VSDPRWQADDELAGPAGAPPGPVDAAVAVLSPPQLARRARVLEAAIDLAAQGGYDDVQMREVAHRAGVAMGTIYRYFDSKDQLLAAALVDWSDRMAQFLEARPPVGATPSERLIDVIRRASRNIERNPQLTAALITGVTSAEAGVRQYQDEVARCLERMLSSGLDGVAPAEQEGILRILRHVWFAALLGWVNGWRGVRSVGEELEFAARYLLGGPPEGG